MGQKGPVSTARADRCPKRGFPGQGRAHPFPRDRAGRARGCDTPRAPAGPAAPSREWWGSRGHEPTPAGRAPPAPPLSAGSWPDCEPQPWGSRAPGPPSRVSSCVGWPPNPPWLGPHPPCQGQTPPSNPKLTVRWEGGREHFYRVEAPFQPQSPRSTWNHSDFTGTSCGSVLGSPAGPRAQLWPLVMSPDVTRTLLGWQLPLGAPQGTHP